MGACLEYAAIRGVPLMLYVFSDGSLSSNGTIDNSIEGRGKGEWSSDNSSTAGSFFLVYNPTRRPTLIPGTPEEMAMHQQIGYMSADGSVMRAATPAANNVPLLVNTAILNYMALHNEVNLFTQIFPNHGLGNATMLDSLTAFTPCSCRCPAAGCPAGEVSIEGRSQRPAFFCPRPGRVYSPDHYPGEPTCSIRKPPSWRSPALPSSPAAARRKRAKAR